MGVSRAEANRLLNGTRIGGKKVIKGLLRAFPDESFDTLFILPEAYPFVNNIADSISVEKKRRIAELAISSLQVFIKEGNISSLKEASHLVSILYKEKV